MYKRQNATSQFVKIFIAPTTGEKDEEADDISLSSVESSHDDKGEADDEDEAKESDKMSTSESTENDINLESKENENDPVSVAAASNDEGDNNEEEKIAAVNDTVSDDASSSSSVLPVEDPDLIDLTQSPSQRTSQQPTSAVPQSIEAASSTNRRKRKISSSQAADSDNNETQRISKIAKRYKRKFLKINKSLEEARKRNRDLQEDYLTTREALREKEDTILDVQEVADDAQLELEGLRLEKLRDSRERESLQSQLDSLRSAHDKTVDDFQKLQETHTQEVAKARKDNMVEVQTLSLIHI